MTALVFVGCYEDNEVEPVVDATVPECTDGDSRECAVEGGCLGTQSCSGGSFGECQAPDEVCDGIDNDCDGTSDEGFAGLGDPCTAGEGVCADKGTNVCNAAGDGVECNAVAGDGTDEVCDGVDNDCDGEIDNGVPVGEDCETGQLGVCGAGATVCEDGDTRCAPAAEPTDEVCDGIDNDCDGRSDEDDAGGPLAETCYDGPDGTEGVGACAAGVTVCTDGMLGACAEQVTPADEICDGIDNDCDGEVDNVDGVDCVCVPGETQPCYGGPEGTEGVGVCQGGIQACNEDGTAYGECEGMVMPGVELCDARDNDCNGEVDDAVGVGDACSVGQGQCAADGARVCDLESGQVVCDAEEGLPGDEICDGLDNDCDGAIDDVPGAGEPCSEGEGACLARGIQVCGEGDAGLVCDATAGEPGEEICDGIDNDCNGEVDDAAGVGETCEVGVGQCRSTAVAVCDAAAGEVVCPATEQAAGTELCANGIDEDCDGETDEDECTTPCIEDGDCGEGSFCQDDVCVPGCRDDAGCGVGEICEGAQCVPGCRDDDGCGPDELCEDSACVPGNCREDVDCGDGSLCIDSFCIEGNCRGDEDCVDEQICSANTCIDLPGECADPAAIGFGETVGSTVDAGDDFQGTCNPNSPDVVFRLDSGGYVGPVCATTDGSDYDTKLFARSDCGREDTELGCSDDDGVGTDSQVEFDVDGDAFIFVDGFNGASGNFVLTVTEGACACRSGDDCADGEACRLGVCVVPECGDGVIDGGDTCDDGNADAGDGCSDTCQVEDGYTCDALTGLCQLNNGLFGSVQRLPGELLPESSLAPDGEPFVNECDENEVIYGVEAALDERIDRMRALCADIELGGARLVLDPGSNTDAVGDAAAEFNQRVVCPPNHAVSGYVAYAPAGFSLLCTPVTLEDGRLTFGEPIESPILGAGLLELARQACPANAAAGAHAGRADDASVYALSLRCDTYSDLCDAPSVCAPIGDCFTDDDCEDGEVCTDFFCLGTELCDDGVGNNGNEQVDCFDDASCAEHPACVAGACETPEDCEGAPCVEGVCALPGDAVIAIAQPGHHVATAGELDDQDPTWERPSAACVGGGPDGAKFYETRTIVNNTGAQQQVTIQTADPDFDGYVHIFVDPFDAALTPEGCITGNDDFAPGSRVSNVDMAPGEQLVIVVSTFNDGFTGAYTVDITTQSPDEECGDALDNDDDGLVDCDDPDCATALACAVCGDDVLSEGEECDDGNLDPIDGCDAECNIEVEICDNAIDDEGDGAVDCDDPDCAIDPACIVPVGSCDEPTLLEGPGVVEGNTAGQPALQTETAEDCVTVNPGQALSPEAVIAFEAANAGVHCFSTRDSAFDTVLYVRQDVCDDPAAEVACNDDNGPIAGGTRSAIELDVAADSTYFVFVDGFGEGRSGDFILTVTEGACAPPPPPEVCDDGEDNDGDGATDCDDPDCVDDPACEAPVCVPDAFEGDNGGGVGEPTPEAVLDPGIYTDLTVCAGDAQPQDAFAVPVCPGGVVRAIVTHDPALQAALIMGFADEENPRLVEQTVAGSFTAEVTNDIGAESALVVVAANGELLYDLEIVVEGCDAPGEICDNAADDDGDGAVDCDDPDCVDDPVCAPADEVIAFVTSSQHMGNLGGLAGADQICNDLATAAGLPGTYLAWLSTDDESPATRFVPHDGPYVTTTGVRIADDWADLTDGTLAAAISADENGAEPAAENIFTGTEADGTSRAPNCLGWTTDAVESAWMGDSSNPPQSPAWWSSRRALSCDFPRGRFYCFQQPGPVVVPEICDNAADDDGDGAVDCDDPDCVDDPACAPRIAACDAPTAIDGPGLYEGSTAGASNDIVTSACQPNANGNEIAFSVSTPVPSTLCLTSTGFDTILYARTGDCAAGEPNGCSDDGVGVPGNGSRLELTTEADVDYFVFLDGWNGQGGDYQLDVVAGTCAQPGVELCGNGADDNADGLVDCDDPTCADDDLCREPTPEVCDDLIDNDIDGGTDCDDEDCVDDPACAVVAEICDDGIDNAGDGQLDCALNECAVDPICTDHALCAFAGPVAGPFGSRGDAFWFNDGAAGADVYSSGDVDDSGESILRLQKTLPTGGRIGFDYRVSSEPTFDFLEFYIDGGLADRWSGNVDWTTVAYDLEAGAHDFEWRYIKDGSDSAGEDRGLIRRLTFIADDVCPPVVDEVCDDGVDNDFDGAVDCADDACIGAPACPLGQCPADDRFESNDDVDNATPLMPGRYDDLARCTDDDYYVVDVCGAGTITVDALFVDADGDIDLQLLDADGVVASGTSSDDNERVEYTLPTDDPAQVFARVYFADNSYSLDVAVQCPELCGNGGDDDGDGAVDCDDPDCVDDAACNPLRTEVELDPGQAVVNAGEANVGNLAADAFLWQGQRHAVQNGGPSPEIALTNGGGFRGDPIPADSELTDDVLNALFPFGNTVVIVDAVERADLLAMLENAVSDVANLDGRFAQIAGFEFVWNSSALAGRRVVSARLDDGTVLIDSGEVVDGPPVVIATNSFLAADASGYVFPDVQVDTQVDMVDALKGYIIDQLDGVVTEAAYPIGGEGRITALVAEEAGVNCDDGEDNDGNGVSDCNDPACVDDPICAQPDDCLDDGDCVGNAVCRGLPGQCIPVGVCAAGGDAYEPNDSADAAVALPGPGRYSPAAICGDEEDFFSLGVCPGGTLTIDIYFTDDDGDLELEVVGGPSSTSSTDDETVAVTNDTADPVVYVWRVYEFGDPTNGYAMDVSVEGCGVEDVCDDGVDNDADGSIDCEDADCVDDPACAPGAVVITEVMQNPSAVADGDGEWFEVYNDTGADLDLEGWTFAEADRGNAFTVIGSLPLPAGGYVVFGKNPVEAENGGVVVDYVFGGDMALGNGSDDISVIDRDGNEVSSVAWDNGATFPDPNGASMQFDARLAPTVENVADGNNWCEGISAYGDGDFGTPGAANDPCGPIGGAPVPIADLSQAIALDGAIEDGDALWALPDADCTPRGDGRSYPYDSYQIVNDTGAPQYLDLTAILPQDGTGDGMLHVFDGDFDPAVLDNCIVGGDNADGGFYTESFIGAVPIDAGQILTIVLSGELPVPDAGPQPIGGPSVVYFGDYTIDVLTAAPNAADFCRLQSPDVIEGAQDEVVTVYGRLYEMGFTDRSARVDRFSRIRGQVGVLPDGADPADDGAWTWTDAVANGDYDGDAAGEPNNDEYQADVTLPADGLYSYAFRFTVDSGISYQMCDLDGAGENADAGDFSIDQAGVMLVEPSACARACQDLDDCGLLGVPFPGVPADRATCDQQCADGVITEQQAECIDAALDPPGQCGAGGLFGCQ